MAMAVMWANSGTRLAGERREVRKAHYTGGTGIVLYRYR